MKDLNKLKLPLIIKNRILISPGVWNNILFTKESIKQSHKEARYTKDNCSLYEDHDDKEVGKYIGGVQNIKLKGDNLVGDLHIVTSDAAAKLSFGAHFGISPKILPVFTDKQKSTLKNYEVINFSVVVVPAIKKAYINNSEVNLMASEEEKPKEEVTNPKIPEEKTKPNDEEKFASLVDVLKKAKEIRKEGESWKDAVARAKEMLKGEGNKVEEGKEKFEEEDAPTEEEELEILAAIKDIIKKAQEIRKEGEPWKDAIKRAAKMLKDGEDKEPEEEKPEDKKPEDEDLASVLNDVVQTYENLSEGDNFDDTIKEVKNVLESLKKSKTYEYSYKYAKKKDSEEEEPKDEDKPDPEEKKLPKKQEEDSFDVKEIIDALKKIRAGSEDDDFKAKLAAVIEGLTKGAGKTVDPKTENSDIFELNDKIVGALKEAEKEIDLLGKVKDKLTTDNLSISRKLQKFQAREQEDKKLKFNNRVKEALNKYVKYFNIKGEEVQSTEKMLSNFSEDMLERTIDHLEKKQLTTLEAQPQISTRPSEELRTVVVQKEYDNMTAKEKTDWLFKNMSKK